MVATVSGTDPDAGTALAYSFCGGNENNAFYLNVASIFVNNVSAINYEKVSQYNLNVRVTDGAFASIGIVKVFVRNMNDPITVFPLNISTAENQVLNSMVGPQVQFHDEDFDQSPVFSITAGNIDSTFKIDECSGQIRLSNPVLNFEARPFYYLTVHIWDTGLPPTQSSALVTIALTDVNDRPTMGELASYTLSVPENSLAGYVIGPLPALDEDNDTLTLVIASGDAKGFFSTAPVGLYGPAMGIFENHAIYQLVLSGKVVAAGDGSGEGQPSSRLVLDYEDTSRTAPTFTLQIFVSDNRDPIGSNLPPISNTFIVNIEDGNDRFVRVLSCSLYGYQTVDVV